MWRGISLANKCLLLFGAAVVLIIIAALTVPWLRLTSIVDESEFAISRRAVERYIERSGAAGPAITDGAALLDPEDAQSGNVRVLAADTDPEDDRFVGEAIRKFTEDRGAAEAAAVSWFGTDRVYRYARAIRGPGGALRSVVVLERISGEARGQLVRNAIYLVSAGLIALGLAVLVFYLITSRLILSPVRSLRETAELVRQGDLSIRSQISTGDEFEELSGTFNQMLDGLRASQEQLRAINTSLDLKVGELSERNLALHQSNRLKGEFLATVSHELRTPLNSIIGFAELLDEAAQREQEAGDDSSRLHKRRRYIEHILTAGRELLELVNSVLETARIEAGKLELKIEPVNLREFCEAMAALMRPFADKNQVELVLDVPAPGELPTIRTDPRKLQQIVFNLMSNGVKFTADFVRDEAARTPGAAPRSARVTLRAERLNPTADEGPESSPRVRISVIDTGPGIATEHQKLIFEKFQQVESGLTRRHAGTGLGLSISKELTHVLQGELMLDSRPGAGSMFTVMLPLDIDPSRAQETRLEMAFRGALASQRSGEGQ
jgi:signal transduction histidine kinase